MVYRVYWNRLDTGGNRYARRYFANAIPKDQSAQSSSIAAEAVRYFKRMDDAVVPEDVVAVVLLVEDVVLAVVVSEVVVVVVDSDVVVVVVVDLDVAVVVVVVSVVVISGA